MSDSDPVPALPASLSEDAELTDQESSSREQSPDEPSRSDNPTDTTKRLPPSLKSISDSRNINPNSTALGVLGRARNSPQIPSSFAGGASMDNSVMAKARALHQQRMQKGMASGSSSPITTMATSPGAINALPGGLRMPTNLPNIPNMQNMQNMQNSLRRPVPVPHPRSAPVVPRQTLGERRARMGLGMGMKLTDMGSGGPSPGIMAPGGPRLSNITSSDASANGSVPTPGSKLDDFKKYIDTDKGWITFDGAATITRTGVNFANGQTFSISLDEVEIVGELGKGNYGTVYKVRHAKPAAPRFGHGLSGFKMGQPQRRPSMPAQDLERARPSITRDEADDTSGKIVAMKEIRLELDDSKFTTILKELVILHECVSPYIIDFYGAFFQEGAVYICIEFMDGGSIDKLYAGGIPESILRKITHSAVMGLKSLKDDHNIIHRDVKPTNILANTKGQIKICDFGVSGNLVASIAKTNIGCQSYMAPERISGGALAQSGNPDGSYNVQSDIWSLGLTIIECAMGRYPYPPEASSTIFSQLNAIVEGEPPRLPETGYSENAHDFVKSCLHKVPKLRATYAILLQHPWLKSLSKPQTITEEVEEGEAADKAAEAVGKMDLSSGTGDEEIADWVKSVLRRRDGGQEGSGPGRPALHAAPLDSASPLGSPLLRKS